MFMLIFKRCCFFTKSQMVAKQTTSFCEYETAYSVKVLNMNLDRKMCCKTCAWYTVHMQLKMWIIAMIILSLFACKRPRCFDTSEVCTLSSVLQHPSSWVHVQLQHVEHPVVLLCTSKELFHGDMTISITVDSC